MKGLKMSELVTAPDSPTTGKRLIYPKSDGWYGKDSEGVEIKISGATNVNDLVDVDASSPEKGDFLVYDINDDSKWASAKTTGSVFGCSWDHAESSVEDTNGTSNYEDYISLDAVSCKIGKHFRIGVNVCWNMDTASNNIQIQLDIDGTAIGLLELETKDTGADIRNWNCGFFYFVATAATHTLTMSYRPENANDVATIYYGGLEWWRTEL